MVRSVKIPGYRIKDLVKKWNCKKWGESVTRRMENDRGRNMNWRNDKRRKTLND